MKRAWVVLGLIAAVKYAEGSQLGHIAFTDADRLQGERCYYDLDIAPAREIHRDLLRGRLALDVAFDVIAARWEKVTATMTSPSNAPPQAANPSSCHHAGEFTLR